ncbi:MAG: ATP-binding protein [Cyanobium sp.]
MATPAPTRSAGAGPCWLRAESRLIRHRVSGIGLSVVRLLIEAMGGRVQVADAPGGGADFQLVLAGGAGRAGEATRENTEAGGPGTGVLF